MIHNIAIQRRNRKIISTFIRDNENSNNRRISIEIADMQVSAQKLARELAGSASSRSGHSWCMVARFN